MGLRCVRSTPCTPSTTSLCKTETLPPSSTNQLLLVGGRDTAASSDLSLRVSQLCAGSSTLSWLDLLLKIANLTRRSHIRCKCWDHLWYKPLVRSLQVLRSQHDQQAWLPSAAECLSLMSPAVLQFVWLKARHLQNALLDTLDRNEKPLHWILRCFCKIVEMPCPWVQWKCHDRRPSFFCWLQSRTWFLCFSMPSWLHAAKQHSPRESGYKDSVGNLQCGLVC